MINIIKQKLLDKDILVSDFEINEKISSFDIDVMKAKYVKQIDIKEMDSLYSFELNILKNNQNILSVYQEHNPFLSGWNYFHSEESAMDIANEMVDKATKEYIENEIINSVVIYFKEQQSSKIDDLEKENKKYGDKIDILQTENDRLKEVEKEQDKMIMDNAYKMTILESNMGGM